MTSLSVRKFLLRKWQQIQMRYYAYRNPAKMCRIRYRQRFGKDPDLVNPRTRNEKVLWMMLFADTSRWTELADKHRVREYVRERGLGWMLNEQYGVWESADRIDFESLPDAFVLKSNNGYGDVEIVRDKRRADLEAIRRKFARTLRKRYGRMSGEHHYLRIPPRIIAEKLLVADPRDEKAGLIDYKFYCFDGEPRYCAVLHDRTSPRDKIEELYEASSWKNLTHHLNDAQHNPCHRPIPRPVSLERMLEAARILSSGFRFVRVDLYEINGNPVFGELTFSPSAGMDADYSEQFQREMGDLITLPPAAREVSAGKNGKQSAAQSFPETILSAAGSSPAKPATTPAGNSPAAPETETTGRLVAGTETVGQSPAKPATKAADNRSADAITEPAGSIPAEATAGTATDPAGSIPAEPAAVTVAEPAAEPAEKSVA